MPLSTHITDVAVIILSYNEEQNIEYALASVCGWAREIYVVDSFSKDRTCKIAAAFGGSVYQKTFEDYSRQRNWALEKLPIQSEWVLFLDADEWIPDDLRQEITELLRRVPSDDGFFICRRFYWMGKWIRRGYYPTRLLRLFRRGRGRCEVRGINEHIVVDGKVGHLRNDFIHEDHKSISEWIIKHNKYADCEARELSSSNVNTYMPAKFFGTRVERTRWIRERVYKRLPPLIRPLFYFAYRYIFNCGFLDGKEAFIYHFLQGLWYIMLIDIKYLELRQAKPPNSDQSSRLLPKEHVCSEI